MPANSLIDREFSQSLKMNVSASDQTTDTAAEGGAKGTFPKNGERLTKETLQARAVLPPAQIEPHYKIAEVKRITGLSSSTIWLYVKQGKLSQPRKLATNVAVWAESELLRFLNTKHAD